MNIVPGLKMIIGVAIFAAATEVIFLLLGRFFNIHIPIGITLGLMIGVIGWFANKLNKPD